MITRYFDLMLFKSGTAPCINVNQYDEGETWVFTLYGQGGAKYTPSTGAIVGLKSDGHLISEAGTVDENGRVVITETQQMTASAGKTTCELQIDDLSHGTANFYLLVEQSPANGAIPSDSDLSLFQQAVDSVATIETLLDGQDPNEVIETAVDAWLDDHPEATTTVLDGAITIPKLNDSVLDLLIAESASGNPATFADGAKNVPVKSLVVDIVPVQSGSGDPAPDNVRPITGHTEVNVVRTGKNLLNDSIKTQNGNSVLFAGATGTNDTTNYFTLPSGTYTYSVTLENGATTNMYLKNVDTSANVATKYNGNSVTFTLTESANCIAWIYGATTENVKWAMIEPGSTATSYEPYSGTTYTSSLGTTVYGGTLDVTTGVLTVTHGIVDMGDVTWKYATDNIYNVFYCENNELPALPAYTQGEITTQASCYKCLANSSFSAFANNDNGDATLTISATGTVQRILVRNDAYTTTASFKTAMAGQKVVYELATPTTTQLTAEEITTLLGNNVISASSGSVSVIYRADTKMYVDNEINKAKTIIAGIETEFTATKNYTTGDLLIVGDDLYKVTANIANGGTITLNTNVTKTTVAEQLLLLA